jgi:hypothetical protein
VVNAEDSEYAAAARRLADRLAALAEPGPDGAPAWSGDDVDPVRSSEQQVVLAHGRLDDGLLTGRVGIATALALAARLPGGRPEWTALARHAVWSAVRAGSAGPVPPPGGLGWCSGWLGIARGAHLIAGWTADDRLAEAARMLAGRAVEVLADDPSRCPDYPDLLDGLAGHVVAVLSADLDPALEPVRRTVATVLLGRLLAYAAAEPPAPDQRSASRRGRECRSGSGRDTFFVPVRSATNERSRAPASSTAVNGPVHWPMAGDGPAVIGLAHGGSGITIALAAAEAAGLDGSVDLGAMITRTRQWEDGRFCAEAGGWPDLRAGVDVPGLAWCHGAPGVGIAAAYRALTGSADDAEETFARARAMVQTYGRPPGTAPFDGTLCHGLTGLVELHLLGVEAWPTAAREHLADARLLARDLTRAGRAERPGWVCGVRGGRTPNVLTGLAGVAYTLARCHDPALGPSLAHPGLPTARAAGIARRRAEEERGEALFPLRATTK